MKLFSTVLRRKRGVILFVAAFMLPLFFVVVVSIDTFSKRQQTTRNLLESNLWFSGRSALEQLETQLINLETNELNDSTISLILRTDSHSQTDILLDMFIIDQDFRLVYPATAEDKNQYLLTFNKDWKSDYRESISRAETAELAIRNYADAIKIYQTSFDLAETKQQEALAIEGMARSNLARQNYRQAILYYQLLKNKYSQIENLGGHPYGISAPLQLYSIGNITGDEVFAKDSMLITLQMMKDRNWLISSASYFFFKAEYESILKVAIDSTDSRFESIQNFNRFIAGFVIPELKERSVFSDYNRPIEPKRTYIQADDGRYIRNASALRRHVLRGRSWLSWEKGSQCHTRDDVP